MNLSQFQQVVGHRRGSDAGPGQAGDHGREVVAPVEAVFELGEVSWHVFGADGSVGAGDGGLDVAKSIRLDQAVFGVHSRSCRTSALASSMSFRMRAVSATFAGCPSDIIAWYFCLRSGL